MDLSCKGSARLPPREDRRAHAAPPSANPMEQRRSRQEEHCAEGQRRPRDLLYVSEACLDRTRCSRRSLRTNVRGSAPRHSPRTRLPF